MRSFLIPQNSDNWLIVRRSRITCSRLADVLAAPLAKASKNGPAGSERANKTNYRNELLTERITNHAVDHFVSRPMQEGIEREPYARVLYEATEQVMVDTSVGFQLHPKMDFFGGSSDGLIGENGGLELKSPTDLVHMQYILEKRKDPTFIPLEYLPQVIGNLICHNRAWWDWVSFNPYFPDGLKLVRTRLHREDIEQRFDKIEFIEEKVAAFNAEIEYNLVELGLPPTEWIMPTPNGKLPSQELEYDPAKSFASNCDFLGEGGITP